MARSREPSPTGLGWPMQARAIVDDPDQSKRVVIMRNGSRLVLVFLMAFAGGLHAQTPAPETWVEGTHYFAISPAQRTQVAPGKVEVLEVFSYGCPACRDFYPTMEKLKATLPTQAELRYLPASWIAAESWPLFQRAYFAAQALGVADQAHGAMFNAIWDSPELAIVERDSNRIKSPAPTLAQVAAFYERTTGIASDKFMQTAKSFGVEARMKSADKAIKDYRAESTPTLIINGKYRTTVRSAGGLDQIVALTTWLVARETASSGN